MWLTTVSEVLWVTVPIALRTGQIDGQSQLKGVRISLSDLFVGQSALDLGTE